MRSTLAPWLAILAAFIFLGIGLFGSPRRPVYTILGIAFFVVGFAIRRSRRQTR